MKKNTNNINTPTVIEETVETTMERVDSAREMIEFCNTLMRDLIEGYLYRLLNPQYNNEVLVNIEGEFMVSKAEMISRFVGEIDIELDAIAGLITPIRRQFDSSEAHREAQITNDILMAAQKIALRPDGLDALKRLNAIAWTFAAGSEKKLEMGPDGMPEHQEPNPVKVCKIL